MRRKVSARIAAILMAVTMTVPSVAMPIVAAEAPVDETTVEMVETTAEETSEESISDVVAEPSAEETVSETVETSEVEESEETTEETTTETTEETTTETTEETTEEVEIAGLDSSFELSDDQIALKKGMYETVKSARMAIEGEDCVEKQVFFYADDEQFAEAVAEGFGGDLESCGDGIAVVSLPENISVADAVEYSADMDNNMVAVFPDFYRTIDEEVTTEAVTENEEVITEEEAPSVDYLDITEEVIENDDEVELEAAPDKSLSEPYLLTSSSKFQYQHEATGSMYAWDAGYKGQGVKVAVLDTGINTSYCGSEYGTVYRYIESGNTFTSTTNQTDGNKHGTHCAGIIGAKLNGKQGAGIAPDCSLYSLKVLSDAGSGSDSTIIKALNYSVDTLKVDVVSMSLGGIWVDDAWEPALQHAYEKGVIVFASAGNDGGMNQSYPASYKYSVSVAATCENGTLADYSNYNIRVDLSAPGTRIWSTSYNSSEYISLNGTSMACPVAAGEAAVIISSGKLNNYKSSARVDELLTLMKKSAKKVPNWGSGAGVTYLPTALGISVESVRPNVPTISTPVISADTTKITCSISSPSRSGIIYTIDGKIPGIKNGVITGTPLSSNYKFIEVPVSSLKGNRLIVQAVSVNESGLVSNVKKVICTVKPYVSSITISGPTEVAKGKGIALTAEVGPSYATNKKLEWSITDRYGVSINKLSGKITTKADASVGSCTVTARAMDGSGKYATYTIKVIDKEKYKSVKFSEKLINLTKTASSAGTAYASNYLTGERLDGTATKAADFVWTSSNKAVATVDSTGKVTAQGMGTAVISALVNDGSGKKATITVRVTQQVTSITLSAPTNKVARGKKLNITATINPTAVNNKRLSWSVTPYDPGVKVVNGAFVATANATPGTYTVKAEATDGSGKSATYNVTVISGAISTITVNNTDKKKTLFRIQAKDTTHVSEPQTAYVTAYVNGSAGFDTSMITVTSSAPSVAYGEVYTKYSDRCTIKLTATGQMAGRANITIASTDGSNRKAIIVVDVVNPASAFKIAPKNGNTVKYSSDKPYAVAAGTRSYIFSALIGDSYGKVSTNKIKWELVNVGSTLAKQKLAMTAGGTLVVNGAVPEGVELTVRGTLQDGSGIYDEFKMVTVNRSRVIKSLRLVNSYGYPITPSKFDLYVGYSKSAYFGWLSDSYYPCIDVCVGCNNGRVASAQYNGSTGMVSVAGNAPGRTNLEVVDKVSGKRYRYVVIVHK